MARLLARTGLVEGTPITALGTVTSGTWEGTPITALGTVTSGTWEGTTVAVNQGGTGATTHTSNNVLIGAGTGAITSIAPGADGQVLTSTGSAWNSEAAAAAVVRSFYSASYTTAAPPPSAAPAATWTATSLSITVPSAEVANCSKILISVQNAMNVNPTTHVQVALRIERTGPTASTVGRNDAIGMNGSYTLYPNGNIFGIDSSLSTGDHTYQLQFRDGQGTDSHASTIAYHGAATSINYITAIGVA